MKLKLIVAMCKNMGIGFNNNIPWKIKQDLIYFSSLLNFIYLGSNLNKKDPCGSLDVLYDAYRIFDPVFSITR